MRTGWWTKYIWQSEKEEAQNCLAAWGLVYGTKYYTIVKKLGEHNSIFLNSCTAQVSLASTNERLQKSQASEEANQILMDITVNKMKELIQVLSPAVEEVETKLKDFLTCVKNSGRKEAFNKFLIP